MELQGKSHSDCNSISNFNFDLNSNPILPFLSRGRDVDDVLAVEFVSLLHVDAIVVFSARKDLAADVAALDGRSDEPTAIIIVAGAAQRGNDRVGKVGARLAGEADPVGRRRR